MPVSCCLAEFARGASTLAAAPGAHQAQPRAVAGAQTPATTPLARRTRGDAVEKVTFARDEGKLHVLILANGAVEYRSFRLKNPPRLVVDIPQTANRAGHRKIWVGTPPLQSIRVAQFLSDPPISRVVMDLDTLTPYKVRRRGNVVEVELKAPGAGTARAPEAKARLETGSAVAAPGAAVAGARLSRSAAAADASGSSGDASSSSAATMATLAPEPISWPSQSRWGFSSEPLNPMPSLSGFPGLWKTIGADALPAGSFGATGWMDRINRNPGYLTITTTGASWFASLHRRVALAGQFNVNRRILVRRADQLSFGQDTLRQLGKGGCPEPNCFPTNLLPIGFPATGVPGAAPASIPLLFDPHSLSRIPLNQAGFHELYPFANRRLNTGVAEVVFAGHINLVDTQGGRGVAVALRPHIAIPTETKFRELLSNGVQTGSLQGGVDVLFEGHAGDILGAYVNVGYMHLADPDEVDLRNVVPVRIGFNLPRTSRLQLLTEFTLDTFVGDGTASQFVGDGFEDDTIVDGTIGFRGHLTPWFSVSAGYRHTLNHFGGDKNGFVFQLAASHVSVPLVSQRTAAPLPSICPSITVQS